MDIWKTLFIILNSCFARKQIYIATRCNKKVITRVPLNFAESITYTLNFQGFTDCLRTIVVEPNKTRLATELMWSE